MFTYYNYRRFAKDSLAASFIQEFFYPFTQIYRCFFLYFKSFLSVCKEFLSKALRILLIVLLCLADSVLNTSVLYAADAPSAPIWERAIVGDRAVRLFWLANPETDISKYEIYRSESVDGSYALLNTSGYPYTVCRDLDVINGTTYYYKLKAVNTSSVSSGSHRLLR